MPKASSSAPSSKPLAKAKARAPEGAAKLSSFQKFEARRVHRREIKGAAYNPRTIDDFAKAKLRKKLETRGLLAALTWNEKTGNLVSGHQRLAILDALEGSDNYLLDVNVVRLTAKQEKEENIFFNNTSVQGVFDVDLLGAMFAEGEVTLEQTGLELIEAQDMFEGSDYESLFMPEAPPEVAASTSELREMGAKPYEGAPVAADETAPNGRLENGEAIRDPERHAAVLAEREKMRAKMKQAVEDGDTEYMVVVVCKNRKEREALIVGLGKTKDEKYIDARELAHICSIALP